MSFFATDTSDPLYARNMALFAGVANRDVPGAMRLFQQEERERKLFEMKLEEAKQRQQDQARQREFLQGMPGPEMMASQQALAGGGGPTPQNAARMPQVSPMQRLMHQGAQAGAIPLNDYLGSMQPKQPIKLGANDRLLNPLTYAEMVGAAPAPEKAPSAVQEYQFATQQGYKGTFADWELAKRKAGASSVNVNTDSLGLKPKDRFEMEGKLSDDFAKSTLMDRTILASTSKIRTALGQDGALKDQAAIYAFAKGLDPEGAVREADYAAISNSAGLIDRVRGYSDRLLKGERLTPTQRTEMLNFADAWEKVANARIQAQRGRFGTQAQRYNLSPDAVLDPSNARTPAEEPKRPAASRAPTVDELLKKYGR